MHESDSLIIRGGLVPLHEACKVEARDVLIRGGVIESIDEPGSELPASLDEPRVLDATGALVLPGFVNAHTHSYGTLARNFGASLPLEPWMMYAWSITVGRTAEEAYVSALLQGAEALMTGTTTLLDHLGGDVRLTGEAARAYRDLGLRAAVAPMISDIPLHLTAGVEAELWPAELEAGLRLLEPLPARQQLEQTWALHQQWDGADGRISILAGPSAPQRCSAELLDGCSELSKELGLRIHTHLLETRAQAQNPRARLGVLERHGLVNERLIGAHGVWVDGDELLRLGDAGSSLVHNPQSNLQLGSGIAEVARWRANGVNAALGTDGANCGGSLDMISSMRLATVLHRPGLADERRWETPWTALEMATLGGARAIGLDRVGRVERGWTADLAVFDVSGSPFVSTDDPVGSLILSSVSSLARHVVVAGRVVVDNGAVVGIGMDELMARAAEASRAIFDRNSAKIRDVALAQRDILAAHARAAAPTRQMMPFVD